MGKGRRRQTAKTGDKGVYKKRAQQDEAASRKRDHADEDNVYDVVDRFHNAQEDFLKLDNPNYNAAESSEDELDRQDAVMDLALGGEESSDDDSHASSDEEPPQQEQVADSESSDAEEALSSDDDDDDDDMAQNRMKNVRNWGRQKKDYYHGDTADLEIGQEEDDALVEEEAAKEIQAARYEEMKEEDFILSDDDEEGEEEGGDEMAPPKRDWNNTSREEKAKILDRQHPELLPLISHFSEILRDFKKQTNVVTKALLEGEEGTAQAVGATKLGQQYLLTKAMLQSCAGLNLAVYLLLKSEQTDLDPAWIQSHPVMRDLQKMNNLLHKLEDQVETKAVGLDDQLDKLVKASALLAGGQVDVEEQVDEDESDDQEDEASKEDVHEAAENDKPATISKDESTGSSSDDSSDEESVAKEQARARNVANEARFGLRAGEISAGKVQARRKRRPAPAADFGDEDGDETGKSLAATLNSIEQRSAARKRKVSPMADTIDETNEDDEVRRGLAMMEEDLGPASDDDGGMDDEDDGDAFDPENDDDDMDFYAQMTKKSKSKKAFKKSLYSVKPKYPRLEEEIEGERAISKTIMKNRGLVPHKNKLNRNPRVKKREQYRKALIRRKGAVREVRTDEGHKYGGEATGIKTNITRSRKLAS